MSTTQGGDSAGLSPDDAALWREVDDQDNTVLSTQKYILRQMSDGHRRGWRRLAESLTEDERHALIHEWRSVETLRNSLGALGGVHGTTWPALEERARAALACLQMRDFLVPQTSNPYSRGSYLGSEGVRYYRTAAAKFVAAVLEGYDRDDVPPEPRL